MQGLRKMEYPFCMVIFRLAGCHPMGCKGEKLPPLVGGHLHPLSWPRLATECSPKLIFPVLRPAFIIWHSKRIQSS